MDDHAFAEGNIWVAGSDLNDNSSEDDFCLVQAVEKQALSHNPDPASTQSLSNGIKYQFTCYVYVKVDRAIIKASTFKNSESFYSLLGRDQEAWQQ